MSRRGACSSPYYLKAEQHGGSDDFGTKEWEKYGVLCICAWISVSARVQDFLCCCMSPFVTSEVFYYIIMCFLIHKATTVLCDFCCQSSAFHCVGILIKHQKKPLEKASIGSCGWSNQHAQFNNTLILRQDDSEWNASLCTRDGKKKKQEKMLEGPG